MATDVARSVVYVSVCVLGIRVCCAKTAELIEMSFGRLTRVRQRNHCIRCGDEVQIPKGRGFLRGYVRPIATSEFWTSNAFKASPGCCLVQSALGFRFLLELIGAL